MSMRRSSLVLFAALLLASLPGRSQDWPQWGRTPQHTGAVNVVGQPADAMLDDVIYDPFVDAEKADPDEAGDLNAPAVDRNGSVFANSEDGGLYVIRSSGTLRDHLFLDLAIGAAYTPLSIAGDGRILTQNDGHLFVVGDD